MKSTSHKLISIRYAPSRRLIISTESIKTRPKRKSDKKKRLVFGLNFTKKVSSIHNLPSTLRQKIPNLIARLKPAIPFAMMTFGLAGMLYFGLQTGSTRKLEKVTSFSIPAPKVTAPKPEIPTGLPRSEPTHINIPSVGINYPVKSMGRNDDGSMQIPELFDPVTGWYKYSPTPGEIGPSIIVGHVDTYKGPSVFWRLGQIQPGEIVEVTRADGSVVKFKVEALKQFDQDNFPTKEVYGNLDYAGLRLITCGGTFNRATGSYTQNTVVFASIVQ